MDRISVRSLIPGQVLKQPLYDHRRTLLLAAHNTLTEDMLASLLRSGLEYAYLGSWNSSEVCAMENGSALTEQRGLAQTRGPMLADQLERCLVSTPMSIKPCGEPFYDSINFSFRPDRHAMDFRYVEASRHEAACFIDNVVTGRILNSRITDRAVEAVDHLLQAYCKDPSLVCNFIQLRSDYPYLYNHGINTATLAMAMATALGYSRSQVAEIGVAGLVQDMAMSFLPMAVADAPRPLSGAERTDMEKHVVHVLYLLERMPGLPQSVRVACYQAHERSDGSGYPMKRQHSQIHDFAKIVAIADIYDALTARRPWREAYTPYRALEHIIWEANKGRLDRDVVRALLKCLSLFPVGSYVRLTTGETARVVHTNGDSFDRPFVSVVLDAQRNPVAAPRHINLAEETRLRIAAPCEDTCSELPAAVGF